MKKFLAISISLLIVGGVFYNHNIDEKTLNKNNNGSLSINIQDDNDKSKYNISQSNEFPTDGYSLNLDKSSCQNGGTLSQNPDNKSITLSTSSNTSCNLYFDKFTPITIVSATGEVTSYDWQGGNYSIVVNATGGEGKLSYGLSNKPGFDNISWGDNNIFTGYTSECSPVTFYVKVKDESNQQVEQTVEVGCSGACWIC